MDGAVQYSIFDLDSGNVVGRFFDNFDDAKVALQAILRQEHENAADYSIIGYNRIGEAVGHVSGPSLAPFPASL